RNRRLTLGGYPALGLKDARNLALEKKGDIARGNDPIDARRRERAVATFGQLCEQYLASPKARAKRTREECEKKARAYFKPVWNLPAKNITRADVKALLRPIAERAPVLANRIHALLSVICKFGLAEEILESDPSHRWSGRTREHARDRVLSED